MTNRVTNSVNSMNVTIISGTLLIIDAPSACERRILIWSDCERQRSVSFEKPLLGALSLQDANLYSFPSLSQTQPRHHALFPSSLRVPVINERSRALPQRYRSKFSLSDDADVSSKPGTHCRTRSASSLPPWRQGCSACSAFAGPRDPGPRS